MTEGFTTEKVKLAMGRISNKMKANQDALNTIDGQLGDGDIGLSMVDALNGIEAKLDELPEDVGMALFQCAQSLASTGGSSFTTLIATGLMGAAKAARGKTVVPWDGLPDLLGVAIDKMAARGRSQLGDKTVLDALEAVRVGILGTAQPDQMLKAAGQAVEDALDTFRTKPCKQGRARIFGDKSVGLDDPGMVVIKHIVAALRSTT